MVPRKECTKCAIRDAIDAVNTISLSTNIFCSLVCIDAETFDPIRDPVLGIFSDHPYARYSFDISSGSKRLSLGLFLMSLWGDGDIITHLEIPPHKEYLFRHFFKEPVSQSALSFDPHHPFREQEHGKEASTLVPKETNFNETKVWLIPVQETDECLLI